jgi:large subunit ribosomal protein L30
MGQIKVRKVRSAIKRTARQKKTLEALGLHRMNQERVHEDTAVIQGMIAKVSHLVTVEKI